MTQARILTEDCTSRSSCQLNGTYANLINSGLCNRFNDLFEDERKNGKGATSVSKFNEEGKESEKV